MVSKTVAVRKLVPVALVGALVVAECTGHGSQHIEALQDSEAPSFVGTASVSMMQTANVSAVLVEGLNVASTDWFKG
jgi:hypothetical protein